MKDFIQDIYNLLKNREINTLSVMENTVWISKTQDTFEKTHITLNDQEVEELITFISKDYPNKPSIRNPIWRGRTPHEFITDIALPPISFKGPTITIYRESLFSGDFYTY